MSDQFKGYLVNVKLNNGFQLKGIVTNVIDRTLILTQGKSSLAIISLLSNFSF